MQLQLVVDNTRRESELPKVIAHYQQLIAAKEAQLLEDLLYYEKKIEGIAQIDPSNDSGLKTIYRAHESHIRRLLTSLSA